MDRMPRSTSVFLLVLNLWPIKELDVEGIRDGPVLNFYKSRSLKTEMFLI